jgi:hypothetical protein
MLTKPEHLVWRSDGIYIPSGKKFVFLLSAGVDQLVAQVPGAREQLAKTAAPAEQTIAERAQEQYAGWKGKTAPLAADLLDMGPVDGLVEQTVIPGAERVTEADLKARNDAAALAARLKQEKIAPKKAQQQADEGLFGDAHKQVDLFAAARPTASMSPRRASARSQ